MIENLPEHWQNQLDLNLSAFGLFEKCFVKQLLLLEQDDSRTYIDEVSGQRHPLH